MRWVYYNRDKNSTIAASDIAAACGFLLFMIYLFIGIAFASDIFMNAIEKICGATRTVKTVKEDNGVVITNTKNIPVWNDTVANLTLMALGSSAPEILLSVIETLEGIGQQDPGDLGPGTIVGSAAFNLMVITSVCITCLGNGQTSRIELYKVFGVTTLFSLFAYIWMVVVLEWNTKDQVDLWEALVTLAFCPLLVAVSYWADRDFCLNVGRKRRVSTVSSHPSEEDGERNFYFGDDSDNLYDSDGNLNKAALHGLYQKLTKVPDLTQEEVAQIIATKLIQSKQHSRMWYRTQMTRVLMGGAKLTPILTEKLQEVSNAITESTGEKTEAGKVLPNVDPSHEKKAVVEFQAAWMAVPENIGTASIRINRTGKLDVGFSIDVESFDGAAISGKDYEPVQTTVSFDPNVKEAEVKVTIFDNVDWNPDSNFFIKLTVPPEFQDNAAVGTTRIIEVIIQDDDKPGRLTFEKRGYIFKPMVRLAKVDVLRSNGSDGIVSVEWKIMPGPECKTVTPKTGTLVFQHNEMKKPIQIHIHRSRYPDKVDGEKEKMDLILSNPSRGAKLGKHPVTTVAVSGNTNYKLEISDVLQAALQMSEESELELSYKQQILQSFKVNGGDTETATCKDYLFHILTFPYKVILSFVPPTSVLGGWASFLLALAIVGLLTKVVGETATAFGDAVGLNPVITAITLVALGTSLPDTFASRISAKNDKTADNAVGNVTGSNSVNVFLGLGIPWTVAAIYYKQNPNVQGQIEPYCVPAGSLTFNVLVYTCCATLSILILTFRRYSSACGNAELGGPSKLQWVTAVTIFLLWIVYIFASSLQVFLYDDGKGYDISDPFKGSKQGNWSCEDIIAKYKKIRKA